MKRILLWTFERGSFHWDVMCVLILAFLFLIPRTFFKDVPDFMRVSATESLHKTVDKSGNTIFTVKLNAPRFFDTVEVRNSAVEMLQQTLGKPARPLRMQPIRDWTGRVIAYAIWKER
jgi:hypothetical protein